MITPKSFDLGLLKMFKGSTPTGALVACSGGVDSMVLLDLMRRHYERRQKLDQLNVAYINHGQRSRREIQADIDTIDTYCKAHGLTFKTSSPAIPSGASESALRSARYEALRQLNSNAAIIFTGHHAEDDLETILFRLIRGAHPSSIKGIRARAQRGGLHIARPLLKFTKQEIISFAQASHLAWSEDQSNTSARYARNQIRNELIPLLNKLRPGATMRIKRFFDELQIQQRPQKLAGAPELILASLCCESGLDIRQINFQTLKSTIDQLLGTRSQGTNQNQWTSIKQQLQLRQSTRSGGGPAKTFQFPGGYELKFKGSKLYWSNSPRNT